MFYILIGGILLFDLVIFRTSSKCSRVEEEMYLEKMNKDKRI